MIQLLGLGTKFGEMLDLKFRLDMQDFANT